MSILEQVRAAGVVGAGGAGFPTHAKLDCKAEYLIANGAECEPLLRTDRVLMTRYADKILEGMEYAMNAVGAKKGIVATKEHYHSAVKALTDALEKHPRIALHTMRNTYPAGDEKVLIHEVTGRVVRVDQLPKDADCVVCNVHTLLNVADAVHGIPVTDRYVTVGGEIERALTLRAPVGTPIRELLLYAGIKGDEKDLVLIAGGPCMGAIEENWDAPLTKTIGGVLLFKQSHPLIMMRNLSMRRQLTLAQAVCCQCSQCTQLCPRNTLGLGVEPHKAMRAASSADARLLGRPEGILSCCNCGLCTNYACPMGLTPSVVMTKFRELLLKEGVKPKKTGIEVKAQSDYRMKRIPTARLIARMGISLYDVDAPFDEAFAEKPFAPKMLRVPLRMHVGKPSVPCVTSGAWVKRGDRIASIPEGALGAEIHAGIDGVVSAVTDGFIEITGMGAQGL
jgi:Na+-translocating ferredoxin:NAD+ oxidoreductase RnfC subunit